MTPARINQLLLTAASNEATARGMRDGPWRQAMENGAAGIRELVGALSALLDAARERDTLREQNTRLVEVLNMETMRAGPSDDWIASKDDDGTRAWTHAPSGARIERDNEPDGWWRTADCRGDVLAIEAARRVLTSIRPTDPTHV